ncbi:hypothetical protein CERSUDRAFT_103886 [Gelatoporia subvermispora B]|uniref:Cwf19-like C-terminal domain-containing protein n=1 Tax=Ceriporiopsis subvermispora (strain B) TaxID=914234 RepID=M2QSH9_CERS8|nr:hypothetical protein CERSUDRAFT_103886 [Gelatoporia subvermispora B]
MGRDDTKSSPRSKRSPDKSDREHKRKHKHKLEKERSSKRARKDDGVHIVDEDPDEDEWMEKNIDMDGEAVLAADIPTAESLKLKTRAETKPDDPPLPPSTRTETVLRRDEWMLMPSEEPTIPEVNSRLDLPTGEDTYTDGYGEPSQNTRNMSGGVDFFSNLGTERKRKQKESDRPIPDKPQISSKELNTGLREGKNLDDQPPTAHKPIVPGGPGSQWRMMKLKRVYETAEAEGKPVEEVALERFESLQAFEEAKEERHVLDEREGKRASRTGDRRDKGKEPEGERRLMFTDFSASGTPSRSSSFRRPDLGGSTPATPGPVAHEARPGSSLGLSRTATPPGKLHAPIPSVATPSASLVGVKRRALSPSSLNKLQAKVLRARLMSAPDAQQLEKEYEEEMRRARGGDGEDNVRVEVLPTLDVHGNLYDVGSGSGEKPLLAGNRRPKEKVCAKIACIRFELMYCQVETRDPKTGEIIRYNGDDDNLTLGEMLRQERFRSGPQDEKNLDAMLARTITTDGGFEDNLDYMDDNAEKLGRKKGRSEQQRRLFAINDFKRTQKALATCSFCYGEDDSLPKAPVIAMGTCVYLSCTLTEELVDGHCLIVPIQHHLTSLEADDDVWDEARNFMKCLMRMYAEEDKGVVFYETVISLKPQKHTYIECVPLPWEQFEVIPGYFKESILMSETEWSQHKKLIDFSARPGGFRRAMVPNLPYFMVQFDYKGEKGYGHVIEGTGEAADAGGDDAEGDVDEGAKGSGEFPRYFAAEIIGNILDLEPRRWRRPRRVDFVRNKERTEKFKRKYDKYDWTGMIERA